MHACIEAAKEVWRFFIANARASAFGAFLLALFLLTELVTLPFFSRYDWIFIAAVLYQAGALALGLESRREFAVILIFHILATVMELFKTHPAIGSWTYPAAHEAVFVLGTVPLFTGFLYSAVGSYIARAFAELRLSYDRFPALHHLWILSALIYVNFFSHHFLPDIRYALFAYTAVIFYGTTVRFCVYRAALRMPFLAAAGLVACFIWIAENVGTYTAIWLYPSQFAQWHVVPVQKIGSWFLLLILSFALVSIVHRTQLRAA